MSFFVRNPSPEEVAKFKKFLNTWSEQKTGALESKLGDKIQLENSNSCDVYTVSIDTLLEERSTEVKAQPNKKDKLNPSPTVAHGSVNVWSKPSPASLSQKFEITTLSEEIPGTEYYIGCKTCQEKGHTDCPTCQKTGKLVCGQCNGSKKHDCPSCNGYGFFNCTDCGHTGFVEIGCSVCDDGQAKCNGCGGKGYHSIKIGESVDCRQCNATGKTTCLACGGKGSETVKCTTCNNGEIPCKTCRTQKIVACQNCDPSGNVTCSKCKGQTTLSCQPCNSQGGFRHVENLVYKTSIVNNELTISPIEKIRDKIRLSFKDHTILTESKLEMDKIRSQITQPELLKPIEQIHTHVTQNRPNSTLLEKFTMKKATVLDMNFKYENQNGHAYFDPGSGLLYVDVNPLENKISNSRDQLKAAYIEAKNKQDITQARQLIEKARQLKAKDLADSWKAEIDSLENKINSKEAQEFIKKVKIPVLYGSGALAWLLAGFITPMSLTILIVFLFLGYYEAKDSTIKLEAGRAKHEKQLKSQLTKLGLIYVAVILVTFYFSYSGNNSAIEKTIKNGAPLTGDAP